VWIDARLLPEMEADAAEHAPDESGGMLIGYWAENGDAVITTVIPGGPAATRGPTSFAPDGHWQQKRLDEIYSRSGRLHTYLGDWHSHPAGALRPSRRDRATARKIAKASEARSPQPLTLITVEDDGAWRWQVFRYHRRSFNQLTLTRF
jgi:integrative and conjugative element protein (TIGR02256 family)